MIARAAICAVSLFAAGLAGTQSRPNLSGDWVAGVPVSGPGNAAISMLSGATSSHLSITHDGDTLTVKDERREEPWTHAIGGAASTRKVRSTTITATASWEGNDLVLHERHEGGFRPQEIRQVFRLDHPGRLTVLTHMTGSQSRMQFDSTTCYLRKAAVSRNQTNSEFVAYAKAACGDPAR